MIATRRSIWAVHRFWAAIDLLATFFAGIIVSVLYLITLLALSAIVSGLDNRRDPRIQDLIPWIIVGLFWALIDLPHLTRLFTSFGIYDEPAAIYVAHLARRVPAILRPPVFIWWLGHFAMAAFFAWCANEFALHESGTSLHDRIVAHTLAFFIGVVFCAAANAYLINAFAVFTRSKDFALRLWRFRRLIDFTVVLIVFLIPVGKSKSASTAPVRNARESISTYGVESEGCVATAVGSGFSPQYNCASRK